MSTLVTSSNVNFVVEGVFHVPLSYRFYLRPSRQASVPKCDICGQSVEHPYCRSKQSYFSFSLGNEPTFGWIDTDEKQLVGHESCLRTAQTFQTCQIDILQNAS